MSFLQNTRRQCVHVLLLSFSEASNWSSCGQKTEVVRSLFWSNKSFLMFLISGISVFFCGFLWMFCLYWFLEYQYIPKVTLDMELNFSSLPLVPIFSILTLWHCCGTPTHHYDHEIMLKNPPYSHCPHSLVNGVISSFTGEVGAPLPSAYFPVRGHTGGQQGFYW